MKFRAPAVGLLIGAILLAGCTSNSASSQSTPSIPGIDNTQSDLASADASATASATDSAPDGASSGPTAVSGSGSVAASATTSPSRPAAKPTRTAPRSSYSAPAGGLAACALPYVRISVKPASGGDSHDGVIVLFTNTGQIGCALTGYPGVAILNARGQQIKQAARTPSGYLGGVRKGKSTPVALAPGATASALLEGEAVDVNGGTCPTEPALLITPPNTKTSAKLAIRTTLCGGTQIHPVVTGTTGSSG